MPSIKEVSLVIFALLVLGCQGRPSAEPPSQPVDSHNHHHHSAPHGGTLVALAEAGAHLELLLNPQNGQLTIYVLDGEAEKAIFSQKVQELELEFSSPFQGTATLQALADPLTGETEEKTGTYQATIAELKGAEAFEASLKSLVIQGKTLSNVELSFPQGNDEHDHSGHHH